MTPWEPQWTLSWLTVAFLVYHARKALSREVGAPRRNSFSQRLFAAVATWPLLCMKCRDGAGSTPMLSFDGYVEATQQHHLRKAPGRDDMPAESSYWPLGGRWRMLRCLAFVSPELGGGAGSQLPHPGWAD